MDLSDLFTGDIKSFNNDNYVDKVSLFMFLMVSLIFYRFDLIQILAIYDK